MKPHPALSPHLRSGPLARQLGVSPDTLRLYERKGLLAPPARSSNGYRSYPPGSLERMRLVRAALGIGFTLDELALVLKIRDAGGVPCRMVRDLAGSKLQGLEQRIRELIVLRDQLRKVLRAWDRALEKTPQRQRASLLENLAVSAPPRSSNLPPHLYAAIAKETGR